MYVVKDGLFRCRITVQPIPVKQSHMLTHAAPLIPDPLAHFASASYGGWNNPPGGGGNPFIIEQGVYIQWSAPSPPTWQLYISTDTGTTWTAVNGASTTLAAHRPSFCFRSACKSHRLSRGTPPWRQCWSNTNNRGALGKFNLACNGHQCWLWSYQHRLLEYGPRIMA